MKVLKGRLWVLDRPGHTGGSKRIHSQDVFFESWPKKWQRFSCNPPRQPRFVTGRVEFDPVDHGDTLFFSTATTHYELEKL